MSYMKTSVFAQKSLKLNITNIVNDTPRIILDKIDTHRSGGSRNVRKGGGGARVNQPYPAVGLWAL